MNNSKFRDKQIKTDMDHRINSDSISFKPTMQILKDRQIKQINKNKIKQRKETETNKEIKERTCKILIIK